MNNKLTNNVDTKDFVKEYFYKSGKGVKQINLLGINNQYVLISFEAIDIVTEKVIKGSCLSKIFKNADDEFLIKNDLEVDLKKSIDELNIEYKD